MLENLSLLASKVRVFESKGVYLSVCHELSQRFNVTAVVG